ncbi:MAG: hypothetical protein GY874_06705 [Desulfobacteraceae bacterium]|nr:hypothetical protein [Desulfobacteraceae bacterium]
MLKNKKWRCLMYFIAYFFIALFIQSCVCARARVALRIDASNNAHCYVGGISAFTTVSNNLDFLHTTPANTHPNNKVNDVFVTNKGLFETEVNNDSALEIQSVINKLNTWSSMGYEPFGLIVYDEDSALNRGEGGPFPEDRRILPQSRIDLLKSAMDISGYGNVQLFQLLGANSQGGDTWFDLTPKIKVHLKNNFCGIGNEIHLDDYHHRIRALDAQAEMAKWSKDNSMTPLIFIGGGPIAMSNFELYGKNSLNYLFSQMNMLGFNRRYAKAIYFYQGARPTDCLSEVLPETNLDRVTGAVKWIMEQVY